MRNFEGGGYQDEYDVDAEDVILEEFEFDVSEEKLKKMGIDPREGMEDLPPEDSKAVKKSVLNNSDLEDDRAITNHVIGDLVDDGLEIDVGAMRRNIIPDQE
jgi:hypothetical protein